MNISFSADSNSKFFIKKDNYAKGLELLEKEFDEKFDNIKEALSQLGSIETYENETGIYGFYWEFSFDEGFRCWTALAPIIEDGSKIVIYVSDFAQQYILRFKDGKCTEECISLDDDEEDEE